jgi:hypothetical protein
MSIDPFKQYVDSIEVQYNENLQKVTSGDWTYQQWYDYCTAALGDLMNIEALEKPAPKYFPFTITIDDGYGAYQYVIKLPEDIAMYDIIKAIGEKFHIEIPEDGKPV